MILDTLTDIAHKNSLIVAFVAVGLIIWFSYL